MAFHLRNLLVLGMVILVVLTGCNIPQQTPIFPPTLSPVPIGQMTPVITVIPISTTVPTATPSTLPTESNPVPLPTTAVPQPSGGGIAGDTRINFAAGATQADVNGDIQQGGSLSFLISAGKDQLMMLDVGSRNRDVFLAVTAADGTVLVSSAEKLNTWQGTLPATQDYRITLTASGGDSNYDLNVIIPAIIQFSPGATSTVVQGQVASNASNHYMLYALAGQKMDVTIKSPQNDVLLTLYGVTDGSPIIRSVSGATKWSGTLPATQYYMIIAVSSGTPDSYLVQINIK